MALSSRTKKLLRFAGLSKAAIQEIEAGGGAASPFFYLHASFDFWWEEGVTGTNGGMGVRPSVALVHGYRNSAGAPAPATADLAVGSGNFASLLIPSGVYAIRCAWQDGDPGAFRGGVDLYTTPTEEDSGEYGGYGTLLKSSNSSHARVGTWSGVERLGSSGGGPALMHLFASAPAAADNTTPLIQGSVILALIAPHTPV